MEGGISNSYKYRIFEYIHLAARGLTSSSPRLLLPYKHHTKHNQTTTHHVRPPHRRPGPHTHHNPAPLDTLTHDAADTRACLLRGEFDSVRGAAFHNRTWVASTRYCEDGWSVDSVVKHVHSLWDMYAQLAQQATGDKQDGLVLDVLRIQGLGPLCRPAGGESVDVARTADGVLWSDLPFLVGDMRAVWVRDCARMAGPQRKNFAGFLAKLASARVCGDRLAAVGLLTLRFALEDPRRDLGSASGEDAEDEKRSIDWLDIAQLLPAACRWIKEAGIQLVVLSDVYWNDCPSEFGKGGVLFIESELVQGKRCPTGFSPWRYMFWIKRLHEIREEADRAGKMQLKDFATDAIERMVINMQERNSEVLRAYKSGGEALLNDRHLTCILKHDLRDHFGDEQVGNEKVGEEKKEEKEEKGAESVQGVVVPLSFLSHASCPETV